MSSYTDPILTKQGYRSLGTNSDFFMNLSVDQPKTGDVLYFDGLNWKASIIPNDYIKWANLQNFSAHSQLLGSPSNSFEPTEITLGAGLDMSNNVLSATNLSLGITVRNQTGVTLPKGSAVRISGATGNKPLASLAQANDYATTEVVGILNADIDNNQTGTAIVYGEVTDLNTSALEAGKPIYLSPTVAGGLTKTEPDPPNFQVQIGYCEVVQNNNGKIIVAIRHEFTKSEYISDSTTVGRALLTAVDAAAGRSTLGLGSAAVLDSNNVVQTTGNQTVSGVKTFNGGFRSIPSSTVSTTNLTLGLLSGLSLNANALDSIAIGSGALSIVTASCENVCIGSSSLSFLTSGALTISNTVPGTGGTPGTITNVSLEKDSGTGDMFSYPSVDFTINSSGVVTDVVVRQSNRGFGSSVQSGIVLKANAAGVTAGVPADWRGTLSFITGLNTALGHKALQKTTTGHANTSVGYEAAINISTGMFNSAVGHQSLYNNTSGNNNTTVGASAGRYRGSGTNTLTSTSNSVFVGYQARANDNNQTNQVVIGGIDAIGEGSNTTVIGNTTTTSTKLFGKTTSQTNTSATNSIVYGLRTEHQSTETPAVGIGTGIEFAVETAAGSPGNTEVGATVEMVSTNLTNNSENFDLVFKTMSAGATAVERLRIASTGVVSTQGNTFRIVTSKTPASATDTGTAGDICWDANYLYVCTATNTWTRVALAW